MTLENSFDQNIYIIVQQYMVKAEHDEYNEHNVQITLQGLQRVSMFMSNIAVNLYLYF